MKKSFGIILLLVLALVISSCSTMVRIDTPGVSGAEVRLNGEPLGVAPVKKNLSDAVWEKYTVEVKKDGYKTYYGELKKEIKIGTAIGGFFFAYPLWLWAYGPEPVQNIYLEKK